MGSSKFSALLTRHSVVWTVCVLLPLMQSVRRKCELICRVTPALRTADVAEDGVDSTNAFVSLADGNLGAARDDFLAVFLRVAFDKGVGGRDEGKEEERLSEHHVDLHVGGLDGGVGVVW